MKYLTKAIPEDHAYQMSWEYIAGYIDGEGSLLIGITKEKRPEKKKGSVVDGWAIIPSISIQSYDVEALSIVKKFLEDNNIKVSAFYILPKRNNQTADALRISINGWDNIINLIFNINKYSIVKREQYNIFYKLKEIRDDMFLAGGGKWTKESFLNSMKLVDKINNLKKGLRGFKNYNYFDNEFKKI
jgi:hypothetical protein